MAYKWRDWQGQQWQNDLTGTIVTWRDREDDMPRCWEYPGSGDIP